MLYLILLPAFCMGSFAENCVQMTIYNICKHPNYASETNLNFFHLILYFNIRTLMTTVHWQHDFSKQEQPTGTVNLKVNVILN